LRDKAAVLADALYQQVSQAELTHDGTCPIGVAQAKFVLNYGTEASLGVALPLESKAYEVTIPTKDRLVNMNVANH
jgi:hypothetical protein